MKETTHEAIKAAMGLLVEQVEKSDFRDENGHPLALNVGYMGVKALAETMNGEAERSCFTCEHHALCFLFHGVHAAVNDGIRLLNIDGGAAPGGYSDTFRALGRACMEYRAHGEGYPAALQATKEAIGEAIDQLELYEKQAVQDNDKDLLATLAKLREMVGRDA